MRSSCARGLLALSMLLAAGLARADIKVSITGVEGEILNNVEVYLSVERYRTRDDVDEDTVQRLFKRVDDEVKKALRPYGYYEPEVNSEMRAEGKDWRFDIHVQPGEAVRIRELNIDVQGPGAEDPVFNGVRNQTLMRVGSRLSHRSYEEVKGELVRAAEANGYLTARLLGEDDRMLVDPKEHTARINLVLETGPRYHFGKIDIKQDIIRPKLMQRFLRFKEGDPYTSSQLLRTQFALDDSLYFSTVEVEQGTPDPDTLEVPVSITATKSRWQVSLGGGYGTDTQLRGTLGWTNTRLNDRGHRLRFELKASATTRRVESSYDIPIGDPALEKFSLEALNRFEELGDVDTNETTLRPSVTRVKGRWQTVTSLAATRATDEAAARPTSHLLVPGFAVASVPEGFLGESLFSRAMYADVIGSHSVLGSDANFLRLNMRVERNFDLDYRWHLLLRGELGTTLTDNFSDVPVIYRFFAGGDRSVRGFAYNSLSPKEPVTDSDGVTTLRATGGRNIVVGSVEVVRDLPLNLGVATFFDFGNASDSFKDPLEFAAGVGIRYRLPVLSVGLDVAKPLSTNGDIRFHLNITPKL